MECLVERDGDRVRLLAPEVGWFTDPLRAGEIVVPGQRLGALLALGRPIELFAPATSSGRIASSPRERVRAPVGYGDVLYELAPLADVAASASRARADEGPKIARGDESAGSASLVLRSPQTGRFYHRPSPGDPAFVSAGSIVEDGRPIGLIEVMKTFSHVPYLAGGDLPKRAKVVRMLAGDGEDVKQGAPLLEVEPA